MTEADVSLLEEDLGMVINASTRASDAGSMHSLRTLVQ
jgi:hypothetical protein